MPYTTKYLFNWIKQQHNLDLAQLERESGIPEGMLKRAVLQGKALPDKYVPNLAHVLAQYGYKADSYY